METQFTLYSDFECILQDIDVSRGNAIISNSITTYSCPYSIKCNFNENFHRFRIYTYSNTNIGEHFVSSLIEQCKDIYKNSINKLFQFNP